MRVRALVLCGAALASGCSLFLAGDLDDARETGASNSAAGDSGSSEGGRESGVSEAGAADADAEASVTNPKGCAAYQPAPNFCADFDGSDPLNGWTITDDNGTSSVSSEQAFSAPSSAKVTNNNVGSKCTYSRLGHDFPDIPGNKLTVAFRMRLQSPWPDGTIPFVIGTFPNGTNKYCTALFYVHAKNGQPTGTSINVQSENMQNHQLPLKGYPSTDEWSEVKVVVTPRTGGGQVWEVTFTDQNGVTVTSSQEFPECALLANADINPGVHCDGRGATMYYDDIRVSWE